MDRPELKEEICQYRSELDGIDRELVQLFERRMEIAEKIGRLKAQADFPVLDSSREEDILNSRRSWLKNRQWGNSLDCFFRTLMDISKKAQAALLRENTQTRFRVAYQGIAGSYGYEAAIRYFGSDVEFVPCGQFMNALEAVVSGKTRYAVLPVENSIAGMVNQTLDILVNYRCFICGEVVLPISHCLLAPEGSTLESLLEVCSHQQALAQCSFFLADLSGVTTRLMDNTAVGARYVAEKDDPHIGAIASGNCAGLYGLTVLAEGIQDQKENYTRFIVVSKTEYDGPDWNKVSARFTLPHKSGSLHEMLRIPAEEGVSLTSIASRPYPRKNFQYYFYVDMTGDSKEKIDRAIKRMESVCQEWALLGHYVSAEGRSSWSVSI